MVERGLEHGNRELVEMELPSLITLRSEGMEPRYVSFRKLLEARSPRFRYCAARFRMVSSSCRDGPRTPPESRREPGSRRHSPRMQKLAGGAYAHDHGRGYSAPESKAKSSVVEGDAEYLSEQLYRFFKHHEFV